MLKVKVCVAIVGIAITLIGYYLDKADRFDWAMHLFAPQYFNALRAYETTLTEHTWVEQGQVGFDELSDLLRPNLSGSGDLNIAKFRVKDFAWSVLRTDKGMETSPTITIEIVLHDGRSTSASGFKDMRQQIKERYYDDTIFKLGHTLFLCGIALNLVALIPFKRSAKKAGTTSERKAEPTDSLDSEKARSFQNE
jgi:hypothetical protein